MGNSVRVWLAMACALLLVTSCLSDDDTEIVYYPDTAITSFTLGTLNRTFHTTSSTGEDSTYTGSVTGSAYKFYIDQLNGLIYNTDSLPAGTDVTRVLTTVGSKNNGLVIVNLRTSDGLRDSLVAHSSTDSLDFSTPLEFRVYNSEGTAYRRYTATLAVKTGTTSATGWNAITPSADELARLKALSTRTSVDLSADSLDASAEWLPTTDQSMLTLPLATNPGAYRRLLVGNRDVATHPQDTTAVVWTQIVETTEGSQVYPWMFYNQSRESRYLLPRLSQLQVAYWNGRLVAMGGTGIGACQQAAYSAFYESRDNGLTWHVSTTIDFPEGFAAESSCLLVADDAAGCLWLIADDGRQVWQNAY